MHTGVIERIAALRHPQKSCALLVSLLAELRHLHQLAAGDKAAVLLPVGDDVFGHRLVNPRYIGEQRAAGGVQVHPDPVDAVLHHAAQRLVQLLWRHVVLVLPDADRLRVDLDQLRQRVLQPPRNRNRAAQRDVKLRKLLRSQLGGRVNRSPRLADHHVGNLVR